jgi:hypothetical protein
MSWFKRRNPIAQIKRKSSLERPRPSAGPGPRPVEFDCHFVTIEFNELEETLTSMYRAGFTAVELNVVPVAGMPSKIGCYFIKRKANLV